MSDHERIGPGDPILGDPNAIIADQIEITSGFDSEGKRVFAVTISQSLNELTALGMLELAKHWLMNYDVAGNGED